MIRSTFSVKIDSMAKKSARDLVGSTEVNQVSSAQCKTKALNHPPEHSHPPKRKGKQSHLNSHQLILFMLSFSIEGTLLSIKITAPGVHRRRQFEHNKVINVYIYIAKLLQLKKWKLIEIVWPFAKFNLNGEHHFDNTSSNARCGAYCYHQSSVAVVVVYVFNRGNVFVTCHNAIRTQMLTFLITFRFVLFFSSFGWSIVYSFSSISAPYKLRHERNMRMVIIILQ